jgi:hypothetical protein
VIQPSFQKMGRELVFTGYIYIVVDGNGGRVAFVPAGATSIKVFNYNSFVNIASHKSRLERIGYSMEMSELLPRWG